MNILFFKYKNSNRLTIELLDTQDDEEDDDEMGEVEKWSEFVDKYCASLQDTEERINDKLKEELIKKPVFLTRNAHYLKFKNEKYESKMQSNPIVTDNTKTEEKNANDNKKEDETASNTISNTKINPYRPVICEEGRSLFVYRKNAIRNAKKVNLKFKKFF